MSLGQWRPKNNHMLIRRVRFWVKKLQSSRRVLFRYVKGHSGAAGNEVADRAADRGRLYSSMSLTAAQRVQDTHSTPIPVPESSIPRVSTSQEIHLPVPQIEEPVIFMDLDARIQEEAEAEAEWLFFQDEPDEPVDLNEQIDQNLIDYSEDLDKLDDLPPLSWKQLAEIMTQSAEKVVGRDPQNKLGVPYSREAQEEIERREAKIAMAWSALALRSKFDEDFLKSKREFFRMKKSLGRFRAAAREKWANSMIDELQKVIDRSDLRTHYRVLKKLGVHASPLDRRGEEPFTAEEAAQGIQKVMGNDVGEVSQETIQSGLPAIPINEELPSIPTLDAITNAISDMRESMPGDDEISINMIKYGGENLISEIARLLRKMWTQPPEHWEQEACTAVGVLLHKKGDRKQVRITDAFG